MDVARLQDRINWGRGTAARILGVAAHAYRPLGANDPISKQNRFLRLPAAFYSGEQAVWQANGYGNAVWHGLFDAAYTRPGDYLIRPDGTWFITDQPPLLPVLCVRTNRLVSLPRQKNLWATSGSGSLPSA
jgi:hypothetical protein